jgi:hypothetical protein
MADGQDLNSLSRFRKQSGRLVLEEHSHCEVPAGCGGVVLRWRDPFATVPLILHLYTPGPAACFLDGAPVPTAHVDLAPGRHVVAFALEAVNPSAGLILFAAVRPELSSAHGPPAPVTEAPVRVVTADDGTWKATLDKPTTDAWTALAFDDRDWTALTRAPTPQLAPQAPGYYRCDACVRQGAACLGLSGPAAEQGPRSWLGWLRGPAAARVPASASVWIRKVFDIPPPEPREPSEGPAAGGPT